MKSGLIRFASWCVVLLSIAFIGKTFWAQKQVLSGWRPSSEFVLLSLLAAIVYALANLFLSRNWYELLVGLGATSQDIATQRKIYANSQIAKYLPGNVAHLAGRFILCRELGVGRGIVVMATLLEMAGLCVAALCFAVVSILITDSQQFAFIKDGVLLSAIIVAVISFCALPFLARSGLSKIAHCFGGLTTLNLAIQSKSLVLYFGFFTSAGVSVALIVMPSVNEITLVGVLQILASFAIAWLAGFLAPGAPSGIGVRESVLVLSLGGVIGSGPALIVSVVSRLVTIVGDLLFLLAAGGRIREPSDIAVTN